MLRKKHKRDGRQARPPSHEVGWGHRGAEETQDFVDLKTFKRNGEAFCEERQIWDESPVPFECEQIVFNILDDVLVQEYYEREIEMETNISRWSSAVRSLYEASSLVKKSRVVQKGNGIVPLSDEQFQNALARAGGRSVRAK